jgi:hypothetical protein
MDNPLTHKANSARTRFSHLNGRMILLSRLSLARIAHSGAPPKGVIGLTLFPSLPYHPPHAPEPNHPYYQHHGGRLGGVPR